jgi:hypothetical protein
LASRPRPSTIDDQLAELLTKCAHLSVRPDRADKHFTDEDELRVVGTLSFQTIEAKKLPQLDASYRIKISVPRALPAALPRVYAIDRSIPENCHTNPAKDLCLGARLHSRSILHRTPTLPGFVDG